ncbi:unnamed protein product, partial [Scytosiphon promiscuus]
MQLQSSGASHEPLSCKAAFTKGSAGGNKPSSMFATRSWYPRPRLYQRGTGCWSCSFRREIGRLLACPKPTDHNMHAHPYRHRPTVVDTLPCARENYRSSF